jgi:hypothetical protein
MTKPKPLPANEAKMKIIEIMETGNMDLSSHTIRQRMIERSASIDDIKHAICVGEINRNPEWSDEYQTWKYRFEGEDVDGIALTVIVAHDHNHYRIKIITIFD